MKVAVLSPGYPPVMGGVETVVAAICERLIAMHIEVEVWTHDRTVDIAATEELNGVVVRRFPTTSSERFPMSRQLWSYVRRHGGEVDLIHGHSFHSTASLSVLRAPSSIPFVFSPHYHGTGHTKLATALHRPYRTAGRKLFHRAHRVVAVSKSEALLTAADYPDVPSRTEVIYNGVDTEAIDSGEVMPGQPPTLLVLGRLLPYKRVDRVISAFARSQQPSKLVIIGEGTDRERLELIAAGTPRASDIAFLGRIPQEALNNWLRTARGLVSLSEHEAFGLVGLEQVAAGGRAVLSDLPSHRELRDLAPEGTIDLVDSDSASLHESFNAALSCANAGPRPVRSWDVVAEEHLALYNGVLAQSVR